MKGGGAKPGASECRHAERAVSAARPQYRHFVQYGRRSSQRRGGGWIKEILSGFGGQPNQGYHDIMKFL